MKMEIKRKDTVIINDKEYVVVNVNESRIGAVNFVDNSEIVILLRPFPEKKEGLDLETVAIPGGNYVSKTVAAKFLEIDRVTLQNHIRNSSIDVIHFPDLGYLIERDTLLEFALNRRKQGRPTIYSKE